MRSRVAWPLLISAPLTACSLLYPVDDLTGGAQDGGQALLSDASTDADANAGMDATADALATDSGPSYRDEVLADTPLAYWRLGETTGAVAKNEVSSGSTGSYQGSVTRGVPGAIRGDGNTAIRVDGSGYVEMGTEFVFSGAQPFSIEAWAKPATRDSEYRALVGHLVTNGSGRQGFALWHHVTSGLGIERNRDYSSNPADFCGSDDGLVLDVYSHVVASFDGARLHLFVNAVEVANASSDLLIVPTSTPLTIGGGFEVSKFIGALDEVALYDRALPLNRIAAHHAAGVR